MLLVCTIDQPPPPPSAFWVFGLTPFCASAAPVAMGNGGLHWHVAEVHGKIQEGFVSSRRGVPNYV